MGVTRPRRGSFHHRVYVDLVCGKKLFFRKRPLFEMVADKYGMTPSQVRWIYDRYVRPQLREGVGVKELV